MIFASKRFAIHPTLSARFVVHEFIHGENSTQTSTIAAAVKALQQQHCSSSSKKIAAAAAAACYNLSHITER